MLWCRNKYMDKRGPDDGSHLVHTALPFRFDPRAYQLPVWRALFIDNIKRLFSVMPRRTGKTLNTLNLVIAASQVRAGLYLYTFPYVNQIKLAVWHARDNDGVLLLDRIPKHLLAKDPNNQDYTLTFKNGSIIQFMGVKKDPNKTRGANAVGVVMDEFMEQGREAYDVISPMLAQNNGWAYFLGTPKGLNYAYDMFKQAEGSPYWFTQYHTIDELTDHLGNPVYSPESIQREREAGIPEEMIRQEYYCDWYSANIGAVYAEQMDALQTSNRYEAFEISKQHLVYTFWDIGVQDATSIWFAQLVDNEIRLINYYEGSNTIFNTHAQYVKKWGEEQGIRYGRHWAPHDIEVREFISGSRKIACREAGIHFATVQKHFVVDGINSVRMLFPRFRMHSVNCAQGFKSLLQYHYKYDENREMLNTDTAPKHDWSSHCADALRYLAVAWKDELMSPYQKQLLQTYRY